MPKSHATVGGAIVAMGHGVHLPVAAHTHTRSHGVHRRLLVLMVVTIGSSG